MATTSWLIGSRPNLAAQTLTIEGAPHVITAGSRYLYASSSALSIIARVEAAMDAAGVTGAAVYLTKARKVRITASGTFSLSWPADGVLRGGTFDFTHISDTAQTLAALAPFADSPVTITGIGFIRRKETDRIAAVAAELTRCGIEVVIDDDGWTIHPGRPRPAVVQTYQDHRMAMSFALFGLVAPGIEIADPSCVAKTFPGYWTMLDRLRSGS